MRKAERLFQLINLLRGRRLAVTAKALAQILEVSERTIYRDIQALMLSGVAIDGAPGIGYRIQRDFDLPPLMFNRDEVMALLLGSRMVQAWSDKELAVAANQSMAKILAVLPDDLKKAAELQTLIVPDFFVQSELALLSGDVRKAIAKQQVLSIEYQRADGEFSQRLIEPLGLVFWGGKWTIIAWCQLRLSYREFRLDRVQQLITLSEYFTCTVNKNLNHYLALVNSRC